MSYLALARKWRPRDFSQVVGQEHVVSALAHALDHQRVHHAFLLTGTRGIGKTTLARILAKCLNCETNGVSSTPCNTCSTCKAVDDGRFIDLIEVDAASRTKVDDTRDLLDNVQYAPTTGQYKIYLIDEVHMLSGHSFNALLKTLEEPPPHVKFVLATTDPQKLPITVLSRCLQFYLKALSVEQISNQMKTILEQESIAHDEASLRLLARSAKGSLRDGLSLLDQTIAFGGGEVNEDQVRIMLGLVDDRFIMRILDALAGNDVHDLIGVCAEMAEKSVDFVNVLEELLARLHQVSLLQFAPDLDNETLVDREQLLPLTQAVDSETIQLYYQIGLLGKRDIYLAPDLRTGMEMTLLRMLAFTPNSTPAVTSKLPARKVTATKTQQPSPTKAVVTEPEQPAVASEQPDENPQELSVENWSAFAETLSVTGFTREVVMNSVFESNQAGRILLAVSGSCSHLVTDKRKTMIQDAFSEQLGEPVNLELKLSEPPEKTPRQLNKEKQAEALSQAEKNLLSDPQVKDLMENLDASIVPGSIRTTSVND